jgi:hypothetical protein
LADFQGLFDDLPDLPPDVTDTAGKAPGSPSMAGGCQAIASRRHGSTFLGKLVLVAVALMAASVAWHAVTDWWFNPWAWIAAAVVIAVFARARRRR